MADNALSDQIPKRPDQMYSVLAQTPQCFCNIWGKIHSCIPAGRKVGRELTLNTHLQGMTWS